MSQRRRRNPARNGNAANGNHLNGAAAATAKTIDLWRPVPQLPDVEPIAVSHDPTLLLRSLGDPPLFGKSTIAGHYIATVIERSAGLATALAASADLLAAPTD